jgi:hypothetical protein
MYQDRRSRRPASLNLVRFALVHLLLLVPILLTPSAHAESDARASPPSAEEARQVFDNLRALEGSWSASSTRGWQGENELRVLARGSVVAAATGFPDAPTHSMQTMIHLDGDRLLLTHYCEAGNQPRLVLSEVSDDGSRAVFTFLDATNLPSRDHGHMDRAVYRFVDGDAFTSRWTWYAEGREEWLEEIVHERVLQSDESAR